MVMGTSSCHMLNATENRFVPGVAGVVKDGILPGYFGYETGQAAVGDAFDWLRRMLGHTKYDQLDTEAGRDRARRGRRPRARLDERLPHAADGRQRPRRVHRPRRCITRRPISTARSWKARRSALRWIVDTLATAACRCAKFVATGGLPHHNPLLVQIYADVLGEPITVHPCKHGPALGAAILGHARGRRKASGFRSAAGGDPRDGRAATNVASPHVPAS